MRARRRARQFLAVAMILAVVTAAGCAGYTARGGAFAPLTAAADQAIIYVYQLPGSGRGYRLYIDGEEGPVIGPGAYHAFSTHPGTVEIATRVHIPSWRPALFTRALAGEEKITVDVEAGRTYYLRGTQNENPAIEQYDMILAIVPEAAGSAEVKLCRQPE